MAKGATAKINVQNKIALAFGNDYIGEVDKKVYVWADDGGERVQIAIAMTCPKSPVEVPGVSTTEDKTDHDWSMDPITVASPSEPAKVTEAEISHMKDLMQKFNLL